MTAMAESVDRRVLGGFFFVDAITSNSIAAALKVTSAELLLKANHSGIYAIFDGPGFRPLTGLFTPVGTWPNLQNFEIWVTDPTLRYLPRRVLVQAPQKLTGAFVGQQVALYPAPSSIPELNWAVVRASVASNTGAPLPWALVQVLDSDNKLLATGMSDQRGEALLAVAGLGIQVSSQATDPVTEATLAVTVKAWFDPAVAGKPAGWIPNPDDILNDLANPAWKTGSQNGALAARQTLFVSITISV